MRKLMWFTIGFSAACTAGVYWLSGFWIIVFCVLSAIGALCTLIFSSSKSGKIRMVLLGCTVSFLWVLIFQGVYLRNIQNLDGETITTRIEVSDYHTETNWGISAEGKIRLYGKSYRVRVYTSEITCLFPGDIIEGNVQLEVTVEEQGRYNYHSANGIFALCYTEDNVVVSRAEKISLHYFPAVLRHKIIALMDSMFPQDTVPFARALLLGDRSLLDYKTNTDQSVSGIRHVIAVSGLHVSILFSVVYFVFGYRRVITPLIGWLVLLVFAGVAGFSPSVVRACIMYSLILGGLLFQKEYDAPTALAFAVLTMLVVNPLAVKSISLQLSAACVIGVLLFSERIRVFLVEKCLGKGDRKRLTGKLKNWFAASASVTLSTWITTTPLCAAYFGTVSLIGIVTNLLTLWAVTIIFCGILVSCVVGAIYLPLGSVVAYLISWLIRYVLFAAKILASLPFSAVYTNSIYIVIWIVFCYILLIAFSAVEKKAPWTMLSCMVLGLVVAVFVSYVEPRLDQYRFSVLDVGQGQCILIQQDGKNYMVDCGGDNPEAVADTAAQMLLAQGVTNLDGIILTHYDTDHAGAVMNLLERITAKSLYLPAYGDSGEIYKELSNAFDDSICWIKTEETKKLEDIGITLFGGNNIGADNEKSMCVLFQASDCDILITGDRSVAGERYLLEQTSLPDLEVLVAGHHGAKNATGLELLSATLPEVVVISVGDNNRYGQPSDFLLERLNVFKCKVFRTDTDGDIVIRG